MSGETNLARLLAAMSPELQSGEYVFCTVDGKYGDYAELLPVASFNESEGLTLVLQRESALSASLHFEGVFRLITLTVHSSLEAVGLTAAISSKLAEKAISANVIAAYFHDHIFVQADKADQAMEALREFSH